MNVLILGIDGYLGWPLANHLASRGHKISGVDAFYRRDRVKEMGSVSAIPEAGMPRRRAGFEHNWGYPLLFWEGDITAYDFLEMAVKDAKPDAIVHLAECPSAPYSMQDVYSASWVQFNNVIGTLNLLFAMRDHAPDAHLLKLGTMGEYGTPNVDIPEGYFEIEYRGRKDVLPFPKQAGSFYHLSKVHDTNNIAFACKIWGLRATDLMQGVVYGTRIDAMRDDPRLLTRLDFDEAFGTVINRFVCQVVAGEPITVYGSGNQRRGFLPLRDSMECMTLALENPAKRSQHRVFNQFEWDYSIKDLAHAVYDVALEIGLTPSLSHIDNPRIEAEEHYYNPDRNGLVDLGYVPGRDGIDAEVKVMFEDVIEHGTRILDQHRDVLMPKIKWDGSHDD